MDDGPCETWSPLHGVISGKRTTPASAPSANYICTVFILGTSVKFESCDSRWKRCEDSLNCKARTGFPTNCNECSHVALCLLENFRQYFVLSTSVIVIINDLCAAPASIYRRVSGCFSAFFISNVMRKHIHTIPWDFCLLQRSST